MAPNQTILDGTPQGLADGLDLLLQALALQDPEVTAVLVTARDTLRAIGWNRYALRINRQSERATMRRRHKVLTARRTLLAGYTFSRPRRLAVVHAPTAEGRPDA